MATFAYTAVDPSGKKRTGTIEAADQQAAIRMVASDGRYILEIQEASAAEDKARRERVKKAPNKKSGMSRADLALFTRRLADLSSAGLALDRVLEVLAEQSESKKLSDACLAALDEVRKGTPVSEALASTSKIFPKIFTQTLSAGEASGQFGPAAERLADMQERETARRSQVVSALVYPAVLSSASLFVVIFLIVFVVPRLATVFEGQGAALPAPTQVLLAITGFVTGNWVLLLGGTVGLAVFLRVWFATPGGSLVRDRVLLSLPLIGPVTQKATISRYARVLGTLVFGGVSILEALRLAGEAAGNRVFESQSAVVIEEVREGRPIAEAMQDAGDFPPVLIHMAAIGEETGDLPQMLDRVASSLDFEVEQALRRLTSALEPIIVLFMGGVVAFVVLSVMLPIFEAQSLVK